MKPFQSPAALGVPGTRETYPRLFAAAAVTMVGLLATAAAAILTILGIHRAHLPLAAGVVPPLIGGGLFLTALWAVRKLLGREALPLLPWWLVRTGGSLSAVGCTLVLAANVGHLPASQSVVLAGSLVGIGLGMLPPLLVTSLLISKPVRWMYEPKVYRPIGEAGYPRAARDALRKRTAAFEQAGFRVQRDYRTRENILQFDRLLRGSDARVLGAIAWLRPFGVACECSALVTLFEDGTYLETADVALGDERPRDPRLVFNPQPRESLTVLLVSHAMAVERVARERGSRPIELLPDVGAEVCLYGDRLTYAELASEGWLAFDPFAFGQPAEAKQADSAV